MIQLLLCVVTEKEMQGRNAGATPIGSRELIEGKQSSPSNYLQLGDHRMEVLQGKHWRKEAEVSEENAALLQ